MPAVRRWWPSWARHEFEHVIVQSEIETFAIDAGGAVVWRAAHADVVAEADLVGSRLVLVTWGGPLLALDPATGVTLER